jgi:hypothetical protein
VSENKKTCVTLSEMSLNLALGIHNSLDSRPKLFKVEKMPKEKICKQIKYPFLAHIFLQYLVQLSAQSNSKLQDENIEEKHESLKAKEKRKLLWVSRD